VLTDAEVDAEALAMFDVPNAAENDQMSMVCDVCYRRLMAMATAVVMDVVTRHWTDTATMDDAREICLRAVTAIQMRRESCYERLWKQFVAGQPERIEQVLTRVQTYFGQAMTAVAAIQDGVAVDRPIPSTREIKLFFQCRQCVREKPDSVLPGDWSRLESGWTALGFQVWCRRHNCNVLHLDFEGAKHPANISARVTH
jgi:hypothetical protein